MKASEKCLAVIRYFERLRRRRYQCSAGVWTIGWGHRILETDQFAEPITEAFAECLLNSDVHRALFGVVDNLSTEIALEQYQLDALVSWTFNLGVGRLKQSTLLKRVNEGRHIDAAQEIKRWIYAKHEIQNGLILRREIEAQMYSGRLESVDVERISEYIEGVRIVLNEERKGGKSAALGTHKTSTEAER